MPTIAYQLYCSRNFPPLEGTLKMLSEGGWTAVEGYGGLYDDAATLRALLDDHGLAMPSGHFGLDAIEGDPQKVIATAQLLGLDKVIVPWVTPETRGTDLASWRALAGRVAEAVEPVRHAGFTVGWHNHDWDLVDLGGTTPVDLMAERGLSLELDLGWTARSGADPVETLRRLKGHVTAVHLKDLAPEGTTEEDGWTAVGDGTQAWPAIKAELDAQGIDHWVVEHDNPADHARFAARSLAAVQGW